MLFLKKAKTIKISSDDSDKKNSNKEDQKRKVSRKVFLS